MKKSTLKLNNISLNPSQIHKLRGYVGNLFKEHDLIHNHDVNTGKQIYRYPLIQFKLIDKTPTIIALTDKAVQVFGEIFMKMNEININGKVIPVYEKDLKVEDVDFGYSDDTYMYEFVSAWIGLNQNNYKKYAATKSNNEKNNLLKRSMIGNILSMAKGVDYWLDKNQQIKLNLQLKQKLVKLKGESLIGFTGIFKANFIIPDYLAIGKSVSRGFGVIKKMI